ncbi:hypothetical protein M433DRAFT_6452 [Acidomyces richmondensis BFW]|nr:MAG: hypothetical protein FE78DRAFT_148343 [Acidomyces sp. 'richmondensis']KYG43282.1 hypothetical protein M433DRAFT_6452 [Acidomyces richmondensis BFW]
MGADHARGHAGHSHHHHHDTTYLTSTNKSDPGVRITRIGLYVNLGMAIAKGVGGYVFNSQALTADAVHALTDLVSDITTLATISYSLKAATPRFPFGYGKVESLGALGVSGLLLSGGIMIGLQAIMALSQQFFPELAHFLSHIAIFGHSHSHGHGPEDFGPNINAAWLAAGSIIIKEWLYRATMKIAKQKKSSVLASNAYHHRVDSLTSFVALFVVIMSRWIENAAWLDPVGGLILSGMVVQAGWTNTKSALFELADVGMETDMKKKISETASLALREYAGEDVKLRGVQGIKSGQNLLVEIEVSAPGGITLGRANDIEDFLRHKVASKIRAVRRVHVRFTTDEEHAAFTDEFVAGRLSDSEDDGHAHELHNHDSDGHLDRRTMSRQGNGSTVKHR